MTQLAIICVILSEGLQDLGRAIILKNLWALLAINYQEHLMNFKALCDVPPRESINHTSMFFYRKIILPMLTLPLTHKQLEMQRHVLSPVATAGLVLKHQAISIHSAD